MRKFNEVCDEDGYDGFKVIEREEKAKEEYRKAITDKICELEKVIFDLLDGNYSYSDIQKQTGLSEERCKEIEMLYHKIALKF